MVLTLPCATSTDRFLPAKPLGIGGISSGEEEWLSETDSCSSPSSVVSGPIEVVLEEVVYADLAYPEHFFPVFRQVEHSGLESDEHRQCPFKSALGFAN